MDASPQPARTDRNLTMILVWISGIALFLMMVVTVTDVAGRYFSGRSLTGSNEMIRMALAVSVSSALPAVTKAGAHITLELLVGQEGHPLERLRRILVNVIGAAAYAFLTWFLWQAAMEAHEFSEVIGYLELPRAPMILFMTFMTAVCAGVMLEQAWQSITGGTAKDEAEEPQA